MAAPLPNWEESDQADSHSVQSSIVINEDLSDDDFSQEDDDNEPDPFINLLDTNNSNPTGSDRQPNEQKQRKKGTKRARYQGTSLVNPLFCEPSIEGVEPCPDPNEVSRVQTLVQMIIGWKG